MQTICAAWRTADWPRCRWTRRWPALPSRGFAGRDTRMEAGWIRSDQGRPGVGRGLSISSGVPEGGPDTRSNSLHHP